MPCLNPRTIFVNGEKMLVPCGRCALCTVRNANDWLTRLKIAFQDGLTVFITLTYNDDNLPVISDNYESYNVDNIERYNSVPISSLHHYFGTFCYPDVQRYFKRLRKKGLQFSYYGVSEYGPNGFRPHYHIVFNFPCLSEQDFQMVQTESFISWNNGFSTCEYSSVSRLKYVLFYSKKIQGSEVSDYLDSNPFLQRPFSFMSKGLGKDFAMQNFDFIASHSFIRDKTGRCLHTPRYFRKKVFELLDMDGMLEMRKVYDCSERIANDDFIRFNNWLVSRGYNTCSEEQFISHPLRNNFFDEYFGGLNYRNDRLNLKLSKKQNSKL